MLVLSQSLFPLRTDIELTVVMGLMVLILFAAIILFIVANRIGKVQRQLDAEKRCPYCAESIKKDAIVCRFCGRDLPLPELHQLPVIPEPEMQSAKQAVTIQEPKLPAQKQPANQTRSVFAFVFLALFAALFVWLLIQGKSESSTLSQSSEPTADYSGDSNYLTNRSSDSSSNSSDDTSWFVGGTLHKSKMREWMAASYSNRLATAADFIAATQDVDFGDLDGLKEMATDLEICISTTGEGGAADNEDTAFISAMCVTLMYPSK